jgi:predicted N-acetyltransferase YhbS
VHGEFVERLRERLDRAGWRLLVVLDTVTYRQRVGTEARVRERGATWQRLLRELQLTAIELA